MDNNLCIKNAITLNNNYEIKYLYSFPNGVVGIGKRITFTLSAHRYGDKKVDMVANPIVIFELGETDLEFIPERVFNNIQFEIGGTQIDKIWTNQITVLQKKYNLEVKQIGSKVFFPLPINCLLKSNGIPVSKCDFHEIRLWFEFTNEQFINCIKDMFVRTDLIILEKQPVWKNICEPILSELLETSVYSNKIITYIKNKPYDDFESRQIIKFKQNQFTGLEGLNGNTDCKFGLGFNHDIERFYIWFENSNDNIIYKEDKPFDKISFIADNIKVLELDYEEIVYNTLTINGNKGLGKGVYEIEWKNIINYNPDNFKVELNGLSLPDQNICFAIYAESYNYFEFNDRICKVIFSS
jgi:hypothetical protein